MLEEIIEKTAWAVLGKFVKRATTRIRVGVFRRFSKTSPLSEPEAKRIACSVLAGDVVSAFCFRNIDSPRMFIACLRRSSEADRDIALHVLAQVGSTFKLITKSDRLIRFKPLSLSICDSDNDGFYEAIVQDGTFGNGGGTERLTLYLARRSQMFTITESLQWQDRAGPRWPVVEIQPSDADAETLQTLESIARKFGFLLPGRFIDFDRAEFAVERWHKENGRRTQGKVNVHYYPGYPTYGASVIDTLDTGEILWISYFKGPVVGYDNIRNRHFVAFSADWSYNWATCFAWDGNLLWFGLHSRNGLISFSPRDAVLNSYETFNGTALPSVQRITIRDNALILGDDLTIRIDSLHANAANSRTPN